MSQDFPAKPNPSPTDLIGGYTTQHPCPCCHSLSTHAETDTAPGVEENKYGQQFW